MVPAGYAANQPVEGASPPKPLRDKASLRSGAGSWAAASGRRRTIETDVEPMPSDAEVEAGRAYTAPEKGDGEAKLWLQPVEVVYARALTPSEQRRARELTVEHQATFLERWNEHFHR